jgi:hypothetical protein
VVLGVDVHLGEFDLIGVHMDGSEPIYLTAGHWFYTGQEWVLSEHLARAGRVLTRSGHAAEVGATEPARFGPSRVYNVRTAFGTYLVGSLGLVVSGVTASEHESEPVSSRVSFAPALC